VPDPDGNFRDTALFEAIDYAELEANVSRLYNKIGRYERSTGRGAVELTGMVPSGLGAGSGFAGTG
jgi:hypothetical protein